MDAKDLMPIDFKARWARVRKMMADEGMVGLIAYSNGKITGNTVYLADYYSRFAGWEGIGGTESSIFGSALVYLPLEGEPVMFTDLSWDVIRAKAESAVPDTRASIHFGADLAAVINDRKTPGKIGIAPWLIFPAASFNALTALCPNNVFGPTELLSKARMVKDPAEIQRMRNSENVTVRGLLAGLAAIAEGVSEQEATNIAEFECHKYGDMFQGANCIVGTGAHGANGSSPASRDVKFKTGELVIFDVCGRYEDYCGDVARASIVGGVDPTPEQQRMFDAVLAMNKEIIAAIKPGVLPYDLHKLGQQVANDHGFTRDNCFLSGLTGHGVGLDIHEPPDYGKDETPLQPNMIITVEPWIGIDGLGSVRIEDLILVTESGHENLTNIPKDNIRGIPGVTRGL